MAVSSLVLVGIVVVLKRRRSEDDEDGYGQYGHQGYAPAGYGAHGYPAPTYGAQGYDVRNYGRAPEPHIPSFASYEAQRYSRQPFSGAR